MSVFLLNAPRQVFERVLKSESREEGFSDLGARVSLYLDVDSGKVKGLRDYQRIFGWSYSKLARNWSAITADVWSWCSSSGRYVDNPLAQRYADLVVPISKRSFVPENAGSTPDQERINTGSKNGDSGPEKQDTGSVPDHDRINTGSHTHHYQHKEERERERAREAVQDSDGGDLFGGGSDGTTYSKRPPPEAHVVIPFEDFWEAYDKKVGRVECEKKWGRIPARDRPVILDHVRRYVEANPVKQYRKNPAVYLNNKSWNDEIIERRAADASTRRSDPKRDHLGAYARFNRLNQEARARPGGIVVGARH